MKDGRVKNTKNPVRHVEVSFDGIQLDQLIVGVRALWENAIADRNANECRRWRLICNKLTAARRKI